MNFFTKNIHENYSNQISFGISFDVYYKKLLIGIRDQIGFGYTNKEFVDSTIILPKKSNFRSCSVGSEIGYVVFDSDKKKITPFVGIYTIFTTQPLFKKASTPYSSNFGMPFTLTYSIGFNYDIKLRLPAWKIIDSCIKKTSDYKFFRIKCALFLPQFQTNRPGYKGEIFNFSIEHGFD